MGVGGLAYGTLPYFEGTFANYLALTNVSSGELPGGLSPSGGTGVLYHAKPVIVQGAWLAAQAAGNTSRWRPFAPAMEALLDYWRGALPGSSARRVDAATGLPLWHDQLETGCDNLVFSQCPSAFSPECWSEAADAFTLSSPDLIVFLARENAAYANFLSAWAAADDAAAGVGAATACAAAAPRIAAARAEVARLTGLLSLMWRWADPPANTRGWFGAYNVSSRARIPSRTFQMAWPLWLAGLADASQAAAAMDAVLAPDMLGPYGIRSVSSADARYSNANIIDPYSEWRGPIWINANAVLAYVLSANGRQEQASALADSIVDLLAADLAGGAGFHEAYDSDTGAPLAAPGFLSWDVLGATLQADVAAGRDPFAITAAADCGTFF